MGLMDRVKAQATQLAQATQQAALDGKAKLDQAQASRRGDALLRSLGAAVYAERSGRGTPDSQAKIDKLIADISAHERDNGLNLADPQPASLQPSFPADPPSPFPGPAASQFPGGGSTPLPDAGPTTFPDAGPTTVPDAGATFFPAAGDDAFPPAGDTAPSQLPTFFESPEEPAAPESGGTSAFPPEA
jgi:hypothetical protein